MIRACYSGSSAAHPEAINKTASPTVFRELKLKDRSAGSH